uniref:Uncharacterized protein n=1 Tax=Arundo donax TaxID=35708 RepID=A0A0A8ZY14_ARUDO
MLQFYTIILVFTERKIISFLFYGNNGLQMNFLCNGKRMVIVYFFSFYLSKSCIHS